MTGTLTEPPKKTAAIDPLDHMGLVHSIVLKHARRFPRLEMDDLLQAGFLGLITAARKFNPDLGFRFSTYATPCIEQRVWLETDRHTLGNNAKRNARLNGDTLPAMVSLDATRRRADGQESSMVHAMPDPDAIPPDVGAEANERLRLLASLMAELSERERIVVTMRFIDGGTLQEVGDVLCGLSRERVRQIEKFCLWKLRRIAKDREIERKSGAACLTARRQDT